MNWRQVPCETETRENANGELWLADATTADLSKWHGRVQCVYIDPPFFTGNEFYMRQRIGEKGWATGSPFVELTAYSDTFVNKDSYLSFLRALLEQARALLTEDGAFFLHLDTRMDARARLLCDEIFGEKNFVNQIIWAYQSGGRSLKRFSRKHDLILFYQKSRALHFDLTQAPISREENRQNHMRRTVDENGRPCRTIKSNGKTYVYYDDDPVYPGDVWTDLSHLQQKDPQRTGYDTQKPQSLLERVLKPVTRPGDIACDLCCGSGTLPVAAAALGLKFLALDKGAPAISVTRKRLLADKVSFTIKNASNAVPARIDARLIPGIAFYDVYLNEFEPQQAPADGVTGLNAVDQWSAGYLDSGVFTAMTDALRLKRSPALPPCLQLPMLRGIPAILITDIAGNRYCFACGTK